jgi:hypothetical protein
MPSGGTTGQILSKVSNTDYDMSWGSAGAGDMISATYDPTGVVGDAFSQDKMKDGTTNKNYTATEKTKLAGISAGANVGVVPNGAISGATKTKLTYDAKGLVTGGSDATTADIADSTNKRYVTDANLTTIGNQSNTNTGDETQSTIKTKLGAATTGADGYLTSANWNTFNGKQPTLVSSTNIKTVNGASLLGAGDLTVTGGGSALEVKDEGTSKDTAVTSIDFVGAGVTATNVGHAATVTIPQTDISGKVPYSGATGDLALGTHKLTTSTGVGANVTNEGTASFMGKADGALQGLRVEGAAATDLSFTTFVTGDPQLRFLFRPDGKMSWGDGTSVADTTLYRSSADVLKTDDAFVASNIATGASVSGSNTGDNATNTQYSGLVTSKLDLHAKADTAGAADTAVTLAAGADRTKLDAITGTNTGNETATTIKSALGITTLSGSNTGDQTLSDATISTTDITTNNVSTSKHGFFPKLPTASGLYLKDDLTWGAPTGLGDMVLASPQSVTGLKTFDKDKIATKGTSTGVTTISTANASATNYTATLPAKDGTFAMTSDITGTNSGTNTGDQTGGTPAITLGTTNTAGTSPNFLRRDDTILAFDATAPTTQAFGDAAAVGTATVAARRDHKHAMPAAPAGAAGVGVGLVIALGG